MIDVNIRTPSEKQAPQHEDKPMAPPSGDHVGKIKVEPPFTDYEKVHNFPFVVDTYDLGKYWNMDDAYTKEVTAIEGYLREKIAGGEIDNTLEAAKETLKQLEKTSGVFKTDSTVVRVGKVAAYTKFLSEVNNIKHNAAKYGSA